MFENLEPLTSDQIGSSLAFLFLILGVWLGLLYLQAFWKKKEDERDNEQLSA